MNERDDVRVSIDLERSELQITQYRPSSGQGYRDAMWVGLFTGLVIGLVIGAGVMSLLNLMGWL